MSTNKARPKKAELEDGYRRLNDSNKAKSPSWNQQQSHPLGDQFMAIPNSNDARKQASTREGSLFSSTVKNRLPRCATRDTNNTGSDQGHQRNKENNNPFPQGQQGRDSNVGQMFDSRSGDRRGSSGSSSHSSANKGVSESFTRNGLFESYSECNAKFTGHGSSCKNWGDMSSFSATNVAEGQNGHSVTNSATKMNGYSPRQTMSGNRNSPQSSSGRGRSQALQNLIREKDLNNKGDSEPVVGQQQVLGSSPGNYAAAPMKTAGSISGQFSDIDSPNLKFGMGRAEILQKQQHRYQ